MSHKNKGCPSMDAAKSNPERLALLFSPFRSRALNPEHYDEKMKFWVRVTDEYATSAANFVFTVKDVQKAFQTLDGKIPTCLVDVFQQLRRDGKLLTEEEFLATVKNPESWLSWTTRPLKWALNKIWSYTPLASESSLTGIDNNTRVVYIPLLHKQSSKIERYAQMQNQLVSMDDWKISISDNLEINSDMDLLVQHLKATGKLICGRVGHEDVVKLVDPSNAKSREITQAEKGQYDILRTTELLETDLSNLSKKQEEAENLARTALREGKRNVAKHHLRVKKNLEKRALKLEAVLDNLSTIASQIEDAASDARVLSAYEAGKKALEKQMFDNNLTTDKVTDVLLDVQEALEQQQDVSQIIGRPVIEEDTEDFEMELAELLEESPPGYVDPSTIPDLPKLDDLSGSPYEKRNKEKQSPHTPF